MHFLFVGSRNTDVTITIWVWNSLSLLVEHNIQCTHRLGNATVNVCYTFRIIMTSVQDKI